MSAGTFLLIYAIVLSTMLVCRLVPLFALRSRELSPGVVEVLDLIPVAAFAALVANDLFQPAAWELGFTWQAAMPIVAALGVLWVARRTRSLLWCAAAGLALYVLLSLIPL